jgi:nucleoside-diphosphate-sugar epimerase
MNKFDFSSFEIFNLGKGHPVGIDEFVAQGKELIKKYLGKELIVTEAKRGEEELPITYADVSRAESWFGYHPRLSLGRGLENLLKFYAEHRDLYGWRRKAS